MRECPFPVVRLILRDSLDRILLLRRQNSSYANGLWCLPGGKVEYGQTLEDAAAREGHEETGLDMYNLEFFMLQDNLPTAPGEMHCINMYYTAQYRGETVTINEESSEFAWVPKKKMRTYDIAFQNGEAIDKFWSLNHL